MPVRGPTMDGDVLKYVTLFAAIFFLAVPAAIWTLIHYVKFLTRVGRL